jgi:hypothetical protein
MPNKSPTKVRKPDAAVQYGCVRINWSHDWRCGEPGDDLGLSVFCLSVAEFCLVFLLFIFLRFFTENASVFCGACGAPQQRAAVPNISPFSLAREGRLQFLVSHGSRSISGSLAMLAAMRRASSRSSAIFGSASLRLRLPLARELLRFGDLRGSHFGCDLVAVHDRILTVFFSDSGRCKIEPHMRPFDLDQTSVAEAVVLFNCPGVTNRPGKGHGS